MLKGASDDEASPCKLEGASDDEGFCAKEFTGEVAGEDDPGVALDLEEGFKGGKSFSLSCAPPLLHEPPPCLEETRRTEIS